MTTTMNVTDRDDIAIYIDEYDFYLDNPAEISWIPAETNIE